MRIVIVIIVLACSVFKCGERGEIAVFQESAIESNDSVKTDNAIVNHRKLVPEPDSNKRVRYEALQSVRSSSCFFLDPDTSVLTVKIRDVKSGKAFIGNDKPGGEEQYRYYSNRFHQLLSLTQHPGDGKFLISIFQSSICKKG